MYKNENVHFSLPLSTYFIHRALLSSASLLNRHSAVSSTVGGKIRERDSGLCSTNKSMSTYARNARHIE